MSSIRSRHIETFSCLAIYRDVDGNQCKEETNSKESQIRRSSDIVCQVRNKHFEDTVSQNRKKQFEDLVTKKNSKLTSKNGARKRLK
jgi:hypothetical protein